MSTGVSNIIWASVVTHQFLNVNYDAKLLLAIPEYDRINKLIQWRNDCGVTQSAKYDKIIAGHGPRRTAARGILFPRELVPGVDRDIASKAFLPFGFVERWQFAKESFSTRNSINPDIYFSRKTSTASGTVLHVRREDYANWRGGLYYFSIHELLRAIPDIEVDFVISDCHDTLQIARQMGYKTTDGKLKSDFELLRSCEHVIGPPSTFNMLGAWLAGAEVTWVFREANQQIARSLGKVRSLSLFDGGRVVEGPEQCLQIV